MDADMTKLFIQSAVMWGPGMVIAVLLLVGFYKLASKVVEKFVESSLRQTTAVEGLTKSIDGFITRDTSEHREMIILIKVMMEKIERMEECGWTPRKNVSGG